MDGKQAIGFGLLLFGLLLFVSALLGRAGATFAALVYGESVLKNSDGKSGSSGGGIGEKAKNFLQEQKNAWEGAKQTWKEGTDMMTQPTPGVFYLVPPPRRKELG